MVWHPYHLSCLYHDYLHRYGRREVDVMVALIFATRTAMDLVAGVKKTVQGTQNENITHTGAYFQLYGTKKVMLHRFCYVIFTFLDVFLLF